MNPPDTDYQSILRRTLAEKILLKLIEIAPQMMELERKWLMGNHEHPDAKLAWELADAFLRAEHEPDMR
jgi:hypothetical protein